MAHRHAVRLCTRALLKRYYPWWCVGCGLELATGRQAPNERLLRCSAILVSDALVNFEISPFPPYSFTNNTAMSSVNEEAVATLARRH